MREENLVQASAMAVNEPEHTEVEAGSSIIYDPSVAKEIYIDWAVESYISVAKRRERRRMTSDEEVRAWREHRWAETNDEVKNNSDSPKNQDESDSHDAGRHTTFPGSMIFDAVELAIQTGSNVADVRRDGKWERIPFYRDGKDEDKNFQRLRSDQVRCGGVLAEAASLEVDLSDLHECRPLKSHSKPIRISNFITAAHSCELCEQLPVINQPAPSLGQRYKLCDNLSELYERAKSCNFYKAVLSSVPPRCSAEVSKINIFAKPLSLSIEGEGVKYSIPTTPRVFVDVESSTAQQEEILIIPERGSEADVSLCRAWLQICDGYHKHAASYVGRLPTRVIDVGTGNEDSMDRIHLRLTIGEPLGIYIALSHRWQNDTPTSTMANLDDRREGINLRDLPQTYRDAVHITRKLGARFLWIDSLCIIQDGDLDWASECGRMEDVFASAYCTIAISPATNAYGNFKDDVEDGELSHRGWILQERALSRRTIYFIGKQIYWECGSVIWSKTVDKGPRPLSVLGSSQFPKLEITETSQDKWAALKDIFTRYSRLGLTVKTDRPVAMSGLEFRLASSYQTQSAFGIVKKFFGESLLWQRFENKWMEPIFDFAQRETPASDKMLTPPSWSWMAYTGGIKYGAHCDDHLIWMTNIKFQYTNRQCILTAPLGRISLDCHITPYGDRNYDIRDDKEAIIGCIRFDCDEEGNLECRECIKVAEGTSSWREYAGVLWDIELPGSCSYMLILREMEAKVYRRVGVGFVLSQWLSSDNDEVRIF